MNYNYKHQVLALSKTCTLFLRRNIELNYFVVAHSSLNPKNIVLFGASGVPAQQADTCTANKMIADRNQLMEHASNESFQCTDYA